MPGFVNNLLLRHLETGNSIQPRFRGRFEPQPFSVKKITETLADNTITHEDIPAKPTSPAKRTDAPATANDAPGIVSNTSSQSHKIAAGNTISESNDTAPGSTIPSLLFHKNTEEQQHLAEREPTLIYGSLAAPLAAPPGEPPERDNTVSGNTIPSLLLPKNTEAQQHLTEKQPTFISGSLISPPVVLSDELPERIHTTPGRPTKKYPAGQDEEASPAVSGSANPFMDLSGEPIQPKGKPAAKTGAAGQTNKQVYKRLPEELSWLRDFRHAFDRNRLNKQAQTEVPPTVKVNIGRIEVRAVSQPAPVRKKENPKPGISLDEFLKRRNGGY